MKALIFSISITVLIAGSAINAQSPKDSVLARERSIDRPITLHKGQIRIESGYKLSAFTRRLDESGDVIKLSEEGMSYVRHETFVDARFGILENLQINVATNYKSQSQRNEEVLTTQATGPIVEIFEIRNKKGLEDFLVALSGRAPFTSSKLDIVATGGFYFPIGAKQASTPDHSVEDLSSSERRITYRYNATWGRGTPVLVAGGLLKYRTKNFAFTPSIVYHHPLKEGKDVRWQHQLVNNNFEYKKQPYAYQSPEYINISIEVERQFAPWFDLTTLISVEKYFGGWTEINGAKIKNQDAHFISINPGYEILVTPKLWIRQRLFVGLGGKNIEVPFSINTSLVYNFFPF